MNSRDRILGTICGESVSHAPLCFLLNSELQKGAADQREYLERQLALGIDAVAALPDPRWLAHPDVTTEVRRERSSPCDLLTKVYHTPAGDLATTVELTDDWPHGDDIPLMSDFVIPRGRKRLVTCPEDLAPLAYLLQGPTDEALAAWRRQVAETKRLAAELGVATRGAFCRLSDMVCWLCGCEEFAVMGRSRPEFFQALEVFNQRGRRYGGVVTR